MKKPTKRYIVWTLNEHAGYDPEEYDAAEEAILSSKSSGNDWYLTESVNDISAYVKFTKPK